MAINNVNTSNNFPNNYVQSLAIGRPVIIPQERHDQAALILRALVAMSEDGVDYLSDEPYEVIVRALHAFQRNLDELAALAREIVVLANPHLSREELEGAALDACDAADYYELADTLGETLSSELMDIVESNRHE